MQHLSPLWPSNIEKRCNLISEFSWHEIKILSSLYSRLFLNELYEQWNGKLSKDEWKYLGEFKIFEKYNIFSLDEW